LEFGKTKTDGDRGTKRKERKKIVAFKGIN
jgi:hypothetical protein